MALSSTIVWENRVGGSDTNGGGFKPGASGTDWTQQDTAQYSVTDAVTNGTTTITSATASFGTDVVGNVLYIQGGTAGITAGWYEITSRTNATTIVVDRSTGLTAGTGATLIIGGALASIGGAKAAGLTNGHILYVKYNASAYTLTTATNNVSGGTINDVLSYVICGYDTTRTITNTDANRPTIKFGAASTTMFSSRSLIVNLAIDGNAQTSAKASAGADLFYRCSFTAINVASTAGTFVHCSATANSAFIFFGKCYCCEAYSNTTTPFGATNTAVRCLSYNNTGASTDGFDATGANCTYDACVAYGNGRHGFNPGATDTRPDLLTNCIAEANGGYGFNYALNTQILLNCAAYNNTSGDYPALLQTDLVTGFVSVTAGSVFTNAAGGDFSLNNTASRGALLRAAGFPATFPTGTTASYIDIGAAQHQDSGGGSSGMLYIPSLEGL